VTASGGKPTPKIEKVSKRIRAFASSFPETREDHPWGHSAFKVKSKTFLFLSADDEGLGLSLKLDSSHGVALQLPFTEPTGYGLGQHGWVSARFAARDRIPIDLLEEWIRESFRAIAPKSVVKKWEESALMPTARVRRKKPLP
jgi:predicted DNA-binding protein (MmcQ/YjbR family)